MKKRASEVVDSAKTIYAMLAEWTEGGESKESTVEKLREYAREKGDMASHLTAETLITMIMGIATEGESEVSSSAAGEESEVSSSSATEGKSEVSSSATEGESEVSTPTAERPVEMSVTPITWKLRSCAYPQRTRSGKRRKKKRSGFDVYAFDGLAWKDEKEPEMIVQADGKISMCRVDGRDMRAQKGHKLRMRLMPGRGVHMPRWISTALALKMKLKGDHFLCRRDCDFRIHHSSGQAPRRLSTVFTHYMERKEIDEFMKFCLNQNMEGAAVIHGERVQLKIAMVVFQFIHIDVKTYSGLVSGNLLVDSDTMSGLFAKSRT